MSIPMVVSEPNRLKPPKRPKPRTPHRSTLPPSCQARRAPTEPPSGGVRNAGSHPQAQHPARVPGVLSAVRSLALAAYVSECAHLHLAFNHRLAANAGVLSEDHLAPDASP